MKKVGVVGGTDHPGVEFLRAQRKALRNRTIGRFPAPGSHREPRSVRGANDCRIAGHRPGGGGTVVILSVIDNLVKGTTGQAVHNVNLMFGLPETMGIEHVPLLP